MAKLLQLKGWSFFFWKRKRLRNSGLDRRIKATLPQLKILMQSEGGRVLWPSISTITGTSRRDVATSAASPQSKTKFDSDLIQELPELLVWFGQDYKALYISLISQARRRGGVRGVRSNPLWIPYEAIEPPSPFPPLKITTYRTPPFWRKKYSAHPHAMKSKNGRARKLPSSSFFPPKTLFETRLPTPREWEQSIKIRTPLWKPQLRACIITSLLTLFASVLPLAITVSPSCPHFYLHFVKGATDTKKRATKMNGPR